MHDIRSILCQYDMGDIGYEISDGCMVITDLGGFTLSVAKVITEVFATEGIELKVKVHPLLWLEQSIREAPDVSPDAPQQLIPDKGAIVHHKHAKRPSRGFKRGVIGFTSTHYIWIKDAHTNITNSVSLDEFHRDWIIIH